MSGIGFTDRLFTQDRETYDRIDQARKQAGAGAVAGMKINVASKAQDAVRLDNNGKIAAVIAHIKDQGSIDKHESVNCLIDAGLTVVDLAKFPLSLLKFPHETNDG